MIIMQEIQFTDKKETRAGFGEGLVEVGRQNPEVVCLCADLTGSVKMDGFAKAYPERFFHSQHG